MMKAPLISPPIRKQSGVVLFVALVFLVILTLISIIAMRSSTLELRMSGNEQEQRRAVESAQSAIVGMLNQTDLPVTNIGDKSCFTFGGATPGGCTTTTNLTAGPGYTAVNTVTATLVDIGSCPLSVQNSKRGDNSYRGNGSTGSCAYFTIESTYDDRAARGALSQVVEGHIKILSL